MIVALLSFSQIRLEKPIGVSGTDPESFQKLSSRLSPQDTTYEPQSSLELVIDNLLIQKENTELWQQFEYKWRDTFTAEARNLYEGSGRGYAVLGLRLEDVRRNLSVGCFPLHPYTAYLLANLSFTPSRSAIQFIHRTVVPFIQEQPAEKDQGQKLNYIYPTALVENFLENYTPDAQSQYRSSLQVLSGSDNEDERSVIQALFLYWSSEGKLRKNSDQEDHEVILGHLTGLSPLRLSSTLERLTDTYKAIYHNRTAKLYRFYQGGRNPRELEKEIDTLIENETSSIDEVINYVRVSHFDDKRIPLMINALRFAQDKDQVQSDWKFKREVTSPAHLHRTLTKPHLFQQAKHRGLIIYVFAKTQEELIGLRRNITTLIKQCPVSDRIVVAISNLETGDLDETILKYNTLTDPKKFPSEKRQDYGESFTQLRTEWERAIRTNIENLISNCTYYCKDIDRLNNQDQKNLDVLISHLLSNLYPFVPPIVDKLKSDHSTGKQIVQFVAKKLFANDLTDQNIASIGNSRSASEDVIRNIYRQRWGLLNYQGGKYQAQPPTNPIVLQAWDYITNQAKEAKQANRALPLITLWKTLSEPPYGYSEYNFTVLLAAWLSYHSRTVDLNGRLNLKGKNVRVETQRIKEWANTDILDKPQDFISQWIDTQRAKIIFRDAAPIPQPLKFPAPWDAAQKYLKDIDECLKAGDLEPAEEAKLRRDRDNVKQACYEIENWFQPIHDAEKFNSNTEIVRLIEIYPKLWIAPPALDIRGRKPSIRPSQDQRDRQTAAQIQVQEYLEQKLTLDIGTLATLEDCDRRRNQIQQTQEMLMTLSLKAPDFLEKLESALQEIENRRTLLQSQVNPPQSQSLLDGRIQSFLQRHATILRTPLNIQEQALDELAQLQKELQTNPNPSLSKALEDCGTRIHQQINSERENLQALQANLREVSQPLEFERCRQTYDRLAPIFQHSSHEPEHQELASSFDRLNSDLQRLGDIQNQIDKSNSIDQCDKLLDKLEQTITQLSNPQQFFPVVKKLKKQIQSKINTWVEELQIFEQELQALTSLEDAYKFQTKLLANSDRYNDSAQESRFNTLNTDLRQWLEFFQILENSPSNTLDEYRKKIDELDGWKQQQNKLSPALSEKYDGHKADLQQHIQTHEQEKIDQALQWWKSLQQEASQIVGLEGKQRFNLSQEIQKKIAQEWKLHGQFIPDKKSEAQELHRQCLKVADEEKVERIKQLFKQLPRPERQQLIQDLIQMLGTQTEVF